MKTENKAKKTKKAYSGAHKGRRRAHGSQKRASRVGTGIYFGLMIVLVIAILATAMYFVNYLHGAMTAYEASQLKYALERAAQPIVGKDYRLWSRYEDPLTFQYESVDRYVGYLENLIGDKQITYRETSSGGDQNRKKYVILADGLRIGEFSLKHEREDDYGNPLWDPDTMSFELLQPQSYTIEAPSASTVYVNGVPLPDEWIVKDGIPEYEIIIDPPAGVTIPTRRVYHFSLNFGVDSVRVVDSRGVDNPITQDGNTYVAAMNYDDAAMSAEFDERVIEVARQISCFMSKDFALYNLSKNLIADCPALQKLNAFDLKWVLSHRTYDFHDIKVEHYVRHTDTLFSVEISYTFEIIYYTVDPEYYPTAYRLYFMKDGDKWKVYDFEIL